jgi:DNA polymerase/3'-5' exonuclease PolX
LNLGSLARNLRPIKAEVRSNAENAASSGVHSMADRLNIRIAARLRQMAELLEHQGESGFRSEAYRRAAPVVEGLDCPVDEMLSEAGVGGLVALPAIGSGIAAVISEMVATVRSSQKVWLA